MILYKIVFEKRSHTPCSFESLDSCNVPAIALIEKQLFRVDKMTILGSQSRVPSLWRLAQERNLRPPHFGADLGYIQNFEMRSPRARSACGVFWVSQGAHPTKYDKSNVIRKTDGT